MSNVKMTSILIDYDDEREREKNLTYSKEPYPLCSWRAKMSKKIARASSMDFHA